MAGQNLVSFSTPEKGLRAQNHTYRSWNRMEILKSLNYASRMIFESVNSPKQCLVYGPWLMASV